MPRIMLPICNLKIAHVWRFVFGKSDADCLYRAGTVAEELAGRGDRADKAGGDGWKRVWSDASAPRLSAPIQLKRPTIGGKTRVPDPGCQVEVVEELRLWKGLPSRRRLAAECDARPRDSP